MNPLSTSSLFGFIFLTCEPWSENNNTLVNCAKCQFFKNAHVNNKYLACLSIDSRFVVYLDRIIVRQGKDR